jgi:aspartate aminotransferase-like enzyme
MKKLGFSVVPRSRDPGADHRDVSCAGRTHATRSPDFYARVRDKGFVLYPGKLTQVETFRVGCIGAIGPDEMRLAVDAVRDALADMGVTQIASSGRGSRRRRKNPETS